MEVEPLGAGLPDQEWDLLVERMAACQLVDAIGGQEENTVPGGLPRHETQERQTLLIGPVEVFEDEHHRTLVGEGHKEVPGLADERFLAADGRQRVAIVEERWEGWQVAGWGIATGQLCPRTIGRRDRQVIAVTPEDKRIGCLHLCCQPLDQGRLADARLTADQDEAPLAIESFPEPTVQQLLLAGTADQRRLLDGVQSRVCARTSHGRPPLSDPARYA